MDDLNQLQAPPRAVVTAVAPISSAPPLAKGGVGVSMRTDQRASGPAGQQTGIGITAKAAFVPMVAQNAGAIVPPGSANPTIDRAAGRPGGRAAKRASGPAPMQAESTVQPVSPPIVETIKAVAAAPVANSVKNPVPPSVPPSSGPPDLPFVSPVATTAATEAELLTEASESEQETESEEQEEEARLPDLSEEMIAFLTSPYYQQTNVSIAKAFDLSEEDLEFLNEMDHYVLGKSLTLNEYVIALRSEFPSLSKEKKEDLIAHLLAERFMPLGDEIAPSAQEVARQMSIVLPSVAYFRVYLKPLTFGGAAGEVARTVGIDLTGQVRERIRDLLMSKFKGIRIDAQVEEQLSRPAEFGGVGLNREQARAAVIAINDILKRAKVMTEYQYSSWLAAEHERKTARENPPEASAETPMSEEDAEIAAIVAKMPKPVRDTSSVLALATDTILKRLSLKPADEYLQKRLVSIVSTRLRDVRSKSEVMMKLTRDAKVGGMGIEKKEAERAADQIEEGYAEFHDLIMQEEKDALAQQTHEQEQKIVERKKREAEEHARWFEQKIKSTQVAEDENQAILAKMRIVAQGMTTPVAIHPIDVKEQKSEKKAFGDLVPAQGTGSGRPGVQAAGLPVDTRQKNIVSTPIESAMKTFTAPTPPTTHAPPPTAPPSLGPTFKPVVKVSAETAKAAAEEPVTMRPKMDDVKVIRTRLAGPLQELQDLTITSFRRLGKTPKEAAARVMQEIDLLAQESFGNRVDAIRAWQSCPLQKQYVGLVTEAFSTGTPVGVLVEKKRAAGENIPTSEELSAIVELNGRLRI
jgi:hypothetical protein